MIEKRTDGSIRIKGLRGGVVTEIATFLGDMDNAYNALYQFERNISRLDKNRRRWRKYIGPEDLLFAGGFGFSSINDENNQNIDAEIILPECRLELKKVSIQSLGFWEFVGSLNPLQQLREYLKDRHERRKDSEYRECAEKEKLKLENELLQRLIFEKENGILRERLLIMREAGLEESEISQFVWGQLGPPLSKLGRHQDRGLIAGPEGPSQ